jgi:protein associated with RNAse G/E
LLYVKQKKYHFQSDIGKKLRRTEKTIRDWIKEYLKNRLFTLLEVKSGGNNTYAIF